MKINITGKNIDLDAPLKVFTEQKIGDLEKFVKKGPIIANVEIGKPSKHHKTGPVYYAEVNFKIGGTLLRAESNNKDIRMAINEVRQELQIQLKKLKEKQKGLLRKPKK